MISLAQLRTYIWVYWCLANRGGSRREAADASAALQAILTSPIPINRWTPEQAGRKQKIGFVPELRALWLRPGSLSEDQLRSGVESLQTFLYDGKAVANKLVKFADSDLVKAWANGGINLTKNLSKSEKAALYQMQGAHSSINVPYQGVVLLGNDPNHPSQRGVTWIGIRANPEFSKLSFVSQAALLRMQEDFLGPIEDLAPTIDNKSIEGNLVSLQDRLWRHRESFSSLCADILEELLKERRQVPSRYMGLFTPLVRFGPQAASELRRLLNNDEENQGQRSRQRASYSTIKSDSYDIIICTSLPYYLALDATAPLVSSGIPQAKRVRLLTVELIARCLDRFPWIWTKHLGSRSAVRFVNRNSLFAEVFWQPARVPDLNDFVPRPELADAQCLDSSLLISGGSGSGKSMCLYEVLRGQPDTHKTVVIRPYATTRDWDEASSALLTLSEANEIVLVIDDQHHLSPEVWNEVKKFHAVTSGAHLLVTSENDLPLNPNWSKKITLERPEFEWVEAISKSILGPCAEELPFAEDFSFWSRRAFDRDCTLSEFSAGVRKDLLPVCKELQRITHQDGRTAEFLRERDKKAEARLRTWCVKNADPLCSSSEMQLVRLIAFCADTGFADLRVTELLEVFAALTGSESYGALALKRLCREQLLRVRSGHVMQDDEPFIRLAEHFRQENRETWILFLEQLMGTAMEPKKKIDVYWRNRILEGLAESFKTVDLKSHAETCLIRFFAMPHDQSDEIADSLLEEIDDPSSFVERLDLLFNAALSSYDPIEKLSAVAVSVHARRRIAEWLELEQRLAGSSNTVPLHLTLEVIQFIAENYDQELARQLLEGVLRRHKSEVPQIRFAAMQKVLRPRNDEDED